MGNDKVFLEITNVIRDEVQIILKSDKRMIDYSLASGLSGICILFSELEYLYPESEWENEIDSIVQNIVIQIQNNGIHDLSLFSGLSGMGLAISCASQNGKRYNKFISSINEYLSHSVEETIDQMDYKNLSPIDYDVIGGISGILSYLLIYKSDKNINTTIHKSIDFLIKCFDNQSIKGYKVPYVYIKKENLLSDNERLIFPDGCLNTGISHGISGIAAILSIAMMEGFVLDKQKETIEKILETLDKFYIVEEDKYIWKGCIDYKEYAEGKCNGKNIFRRDAWCYGAPGIALAYLYAGLALNKKECINKANEMYIKSVNKLDGIYSPILCHGYAGLLEIGRTLLQFSSEDSIKKAIDDLYKITCNSYDNNSNYGFQNFEYEENKLKAFDEIGLLDGSVGVLLSCFGYLNKTNTNWRRSLLLL